MIQVLGATVCVHWMAGPVVGNRPPFALSPVSLAIRHSDELACGAGLLIRRVDWVDYRPAGLESTVGRKLASMSETDPRVNASPVHGGSRM